MRITRYSHSCVRLEHQGTVIVIDPGIWSEPRALRGADAVLVTHEHADHIDTLRLAGLGVPVYAPDGARIPDVAVTAVRTDERFEAAGLRIRAVGGRHAPVYGGSPDCANLGYVVEDRLYHPGDSLHVPDQPVETLLVPMQASWLRISEAIDFIHAVRPDRSFGIHDAQLSHHGLDAANGWLSEQSDSYRWLAPGTSA